MKKLLMAAVFCFSGMAQANTIVDQVIEQQAQQIKVQTLAGLDWIEGEKADYALNMGGFIQGTVNSFVREVLPTEIWMQQDMDLGFMGKNKVEILFDRNTAEIKKILVNGQEQDIPDASNMEIVEMREDKITVKAGTFDCVYVKILNRDDNTESEAWINPEQVPMSGTLKQIAPSQFGKVTQELTAYVRKR